MRPIRKTIVGAVAALLVAGHSIGAPAQELVRQQWRIAGFRLMTPKLDLTTAANQRIHLELASTKEETVAIDAAAFSTEATATGVIVRARNATVVFAKAQQRAQNATFEMTLTADGVVNMWISGDVSRGDGQIRR